MNAGLIFEALTMLSVFPCCRREKPNTQFTTAAWIERIVILGISNAPRGIFLSADGMDIFTIYIKPVFSQVIVRIVPMSLCIF